MIRRLVTTILAALAVTALGAAPARAGNIALTGHDDDFHCDLEDSGNPAADACMQLKQLTTFVRAGSALPLLVFDQGGGGSGFELVSALTSQGFTVTNVSNPALVTDALFDHSIYSAFVVASDNSCGGCDNTTMAGALAAHTTAINNFFNAGGGIFALTQGTNNSYYSFLPVTAAGAGSPPSSGFVATAPCFGTTVTPVNGDATHNFFSNPGTGGVSSLFCVAENNPGVTGSPNNVTLLLAGGSIVTSVITSAGAVPEPATLTLLGLGLAGAYRRRRRA